MEVWVGVVGWTGSRRNGDARSGAECVGRTGSHSAGEERCRPVTHVVRMLAGKDSLQGYLAHKKTPPPRIQQ